MKIVWLLLPCTVLSTLATAAAVENPLPGIDCSYAGVATLAVPGGADPVATPDADRDSWAAADNVALLSEAARPLMQDSLVIDVFHNDVQHGDAVTLPSTSVTVAAVDRQTLGDSRCTTPAGATPIASPTAAAPALWRGASSLAY